MDPLMKKAIFFLVIFVILSIAQRLTGIGAQPQLNCQLRNTFQMETVVKRHRDDTSTETIEDDSNSTSTSKLFSNGLNMAEKFLKDIFKRGSIVLDPFKHRLQVTPRQEFYQPGPEQNRIIFGSKAVNATCGHEHQQ